MKVEPLRVGNCGLRIARQGRGRAVPNPKSAIRNPKWAGRGFTLIELLLVMVILAVLAAVVVPKFTKRSEQARNVAARTQLSNFKTALDAFEVDCTRHPTTQEGLQALVQQPGGIKGWLRPYIDKVPLDPWGNQYQYRCPGQQHPDGYDVWSYGPDGQDGGDDDIWPD